MYSPQCAEMRWDVFRSKSTKGKWRHQNRWNGRKMIISSHITPQSIALPCLSSTHFISHNVTWLPLNQLWLRLIKAHPHSSSLIALSVAYFTSYSWLWGAEKYRNSAVSGIKFKFIPPLKNLQADTSQGNHTHTHHQTWNWWYNQITQRLMILTQAIRALPVSRGKLRHKSKTDWHTVCFNLSYLIPFRCI